LRPLGRYALGVGGKEVAEAKRIRELTGMTPSILDASRFETVRSVSNALGRIPFYGGGIGKAFKETQAKFIDTAKNVFMDGPTFNLADLGVNNKGYCW